MTSLMKETEGLNTEVFEFSNFKVLFKNNTIIMYNDRIGCYAEVDEYNNTVKSVRKIALEIDREYFYIKEIYPSLHP